MTVPQDWTANLLAYHFQQLLVEVDRRLTDRIDLEVDRAEAGHESLKTMLIRLDSANDARFSALNEFRASLSDQQRVFVPRTEVEAQWRRMVERLDLLAAEHQSFVRRPEHDQLVDRITALEGRVTLDEGEERGVGRRTSSLRQNAIIAVAIGGLLITILVTLVDHFIK